MRVSSFSFSLLFLFSFQWQWQWQWQFKVPLHFQALLLFLGMSVFAQGVLAAPIMALGLNTVYETASDGRTTEQRQPLSVRGGYRFEFSDIYLEYTNFRASQGSSMVYVSRQHQEFILWVRRLFKLEWQFSPYVGAGIGAQNDHVETILGSQKSQDSGTFESMAAIAVGIKTLILRQIELQSEVRLAASEQYTPNPNFGFGVAIGLVF